MKTNDAVLSVSELTCRVKSVLESGFTGLTVRGEISNFKRHTSGHLYFTLKDEHAQIQAVMWRSRATGLFFTPEDGMNVIVRGSITVYEVRGIYQIDVVSLQPRGAGELQMAFERLKQRLAAEGMFDPAKKKPLPRYPARIGIVTSPTGAALHDMVNIISRRFPAVEIILQPVRVQGSGAAEEIAAAIADFNRFGAIDVMIVGRGGGSLEDLWAFNEEIVARAIYQSKIPVISAVGHEIDFTIADFVADLRAPTPSAAAEQVVPDMAEIVEYMRNYCYTTKSQIAEHLTTRKEHILALVRSYSFNRPIDMVRQHSQHLDELSRTMTRMIGHITSSIRQHLHAIDHRLASVNPEGILKRGYAIVARDGEIIPDAGMLHTADRVSIRFHDGTAGATID